MAKFNLDLNKTSNFTKPITVYSKVLDELGVLYKNNSLLCNSTYSRTGGKVLYSCFPENTEIFAKPRNAVLIQKAAS